MFGCLNFVKLFLDVSRCRTLFSEDYENTFEILLHSLGANVGVLVAGVAHLAEVGHKVVITTVVRWRVLFYVGKLHKLWLEEEEGYKVHMKSLAAFQLK